MFLADDIADGPFPPAKAVAVCVLVAVQDSSRGPL